MVDNSPRRRPTEAEHNEALRQTLEARHDRRRSQGGRVGALEKLHAKLANDARRYESEDLQDQRDAVAAALLAVADFLEAQGFAKATLAPLIRPVAALAERENNSLDLMFTERARAGRPKATLSDHERTGILAALVEAWLRTHEGDDRPQSDKLADAARKMKGRWFGTITRAQLETARELVSQEARDHPAVSTASIYYGFFEKTADAFGNEGAIEYIVHWLNNTRLSFGAGEGGISKTPRISPTVDD